MAPGAEVLALDTLSTLLAAAPTWGRSPTCRCCLVHVPSLEVRTWRELINSFHPIPDLLPGEVASLFISCRQVGPDERLGLAAQNVRDPDIMVGRFRRGPIV